jgi:hypothetical protein
MADEDLSQPIVSTADPLATMANAIVGIRVHLGKQSTTMGQMRVTLDELRRERMRWITREELVDHAARCPAVEALARRPRPSQQTPKQSIWATLQQRVITISAIVAMLAALGGAWLWSAKAYSTVQQQLQQSAKQGKRWRNETREAFRKDIRALLKKLNTLDEDRGN